MRTFDSVSVLCLGLLGSRTEKAKKIESYVCISQKEIRFGLDPLLPIPQAMRYMRRFAAA
jgi:hypothetical protein